MSKKKAAFILFAASLFLLVGILPVFANQIDQKQQELSGVKSDINQRKQDLSQNKQEQDKILKEIRLLEGEMNVIKAELRSLAAKVKSTEQQITETEAELAEAEEQIEIVDQVLAVRLRAIYENGKTSYLDVLFSSSSFAEFLTRYNDMQMLIAEDRVLLGEVKAERERIVGMKEALEERRQELLVMRRQNLLKDQELQAKASEQRQLMAALQEDYNNTNKEIKKLEAEAKQLDSIIKTLQAAQRGVPSRGSGQMIWPVPEFGTAWITSNYGYRRDPITGRAGTFHGGVDIGIPRSRWPASSSYTGSPVNLVAVDSGVAYTYRYGSGYGNLVIVDHGDGIATVYAHTHGFLVANGQSVAKGQAIAIIGSTGYSTGPHVHFEVRVNGERVNPMPYIR
ncbi:MAG: peptidoglycan DD-metalloendopeptidase family protein [Bacillota bacterium]|nr:peptidoglycan DD-metalloendopeptidase family protein [Bacillota bacterium]MDW7682934.1 peptidoglycan DD-metalloendopeptidase family protein [Bacillota bacterium]